MNKTTYGQRRALKIQDNENIRMRKKPPLDAGLALAICQSFLNTNGTNDGNTKQKKTIAYMYPKWEQMSAASLRKLHTLLANTDMTTGDPTMKEHVRICIQAKPHINDRAKVEEDEDMINVDSD